MFLQSVVAHCLPVCSARCLFAVPGVDIVAKSLEELLPQVKSHAERLGYPVVIKPEGEVSVLHCEPDFAAAIASLRVAVF